MIAIRTIFRGLVLSLVVVSSIALGYQPSLELDGIEAVKGGFKITFTSTQDGKTKSFLHDDDGVATLAAILLTVNNSEAKSFRTNPKERKLAFKAPEMDIMKQALQLAVTEYSKSIEKGQTWERHFRQEEQKRALTASELAKRIDYRNRTAKYEQNRDNLTPILAKARSGEFTYNDLITLSQWVESQADTRIYSYGDNYQIDRPRSELTPLGGGIGYGNIVGRVSNHARPLQFPRNRNAAVARGAEPQDEPEAPSDTEPARHQ